MAVYKVIQDIESEDKLLGPLTLKGFIYMAIAGVMAFICVRLAIAGVPALIKLIVILILLGPMLLFGVLASPLGRDQPTEVWLLSHVRFLLKPRIRNWDQNSADDLVTITAPKRTDLHLTKEFSQTEVQSRLQALATTLDSRGWVVKSSAVNLNDSPDYLAQRDPNDRLIDASTVSEPSQVIDIHASDDILDERNNATAQKFDQMIQQADTDRKDAARARVSQPAAPAGDSRFLDQSGSGNTTFVGRAIVTPHADDATTATTGTTDEPLTPEAAAIIKREHDRLEDIHRRSAGFHAKGSERAAASAAARQTQEATARQNTVTAAQTAAKLELAQSGNDLSVASVAHLANRVGQAHQIGPGEVEINLH